MRPKEAPRTIRVELTEPHVFTHYYEVAAWYTLIACEPQEHLVERHKTTGGFDYYASLRGIIQEKHTPTLFAGNAMGATSPQDALSKGKPMDYSLRIEGWYLKSLMRNLNSPGESFRLHAKSPIRVTAITLA